jgi:ABC-type sugar transport system ATPase subunit
MESRPPETVPVLEVEGIVKTFPGVRALDGVRFDLRRGEIHALVGENGAGKSTLIHLLGGVFSLDEGQIRVRGRPVRFANPRAAADFGIGIVFQELSLAPNLSVAENIFFNRQPVNGLGLIDRRELDRRTEEFLGRFRLSLDPGERVGRLPAALQQMVEILKALSQSPEVLILDEPTTSLGAREADLLFGILGEFRARGRSVIYVSHHLPEIFRICDRATVLRDGRNVDTRAVKDVDEERLACLMVGRELKDIYGERRSEIGAEILRVEDVWSDRKVRGVSFALRAGEILGIAGLVGAGRTELARAIFGATPLERGRIVVRGREVRIRNPGDAIRNRVAYMTEDRKEQGLFLRMSLRENCVAPNLRCFAGRAGFLQEREISRNAEISRARFDIAATGIGQQVRNLSGGNQQKVLLSMWIGVQPLILIVDEPTRGIDIGARGEIYALLRECAAKGIGVVLISSDLTEILGLSDRVLVMREGRVAGEFSRREATEERIIACAAGVAGV